MNRFEAKTGHQSKRNLYQLAKRGYQTFKTEPFTPDHHLGLPAKRSAPGLGRQRKV